MRGQIESLLEQGFEAARAGENERAKDIFVRVIELDQYNEKAWLWLSSVVDNPADKAVCLENVLVTNPDSSYAATALHHVRRKPGFKDSPPSILPRLSGPRTAAEEEWSPSGPTTSHPPVARICPRCGFRNPGWTYLCDRCGASLRYVDLHEAVDETHKPRGDSFVTVLEAWGGALVFDRLWAFVLEADLTSSGRSLLALILAAFAASALRAIAPVALRVSVGPGGSLGWLIVYAFGCAIETAPSALLLALVWVPLVLLTWLGARLVGGRQGLEVQAHLMAIALSAWIITGTLLAQLVALMVHLLGGNLRFDLFLEIAGPVLVSVIVGVAAIVWLVQAIYTAQIISVPRSILALLLATVMGTALLFGLERLTGGRLVGLVSQFVGTLFMPSLCGRG